MVTVGIDYSFDQDEKMQSIQRNCIFKFCSIGSMATILAMGVLLAAEPASARTIKISLAQLPVLSESPTKGVFIDVIKAMAEIDPQNTYEISVVPFARSLLSVQDGLADVHIPLIRPPSETDLPYRLSQKINFYKVNFVLYSNKNKALDIENLQQYSIETDNAHTNFFKFPVKPVSAIEAGLVKVDLKRLDGFIFSDVATDPVLKERGYKNIRQSFFSAFDVTTVYKKDSSNEVDDIMVSALDKLKANGRLAAILGPVITQYVDWQMPD